MQCSYKFLRQVALNKPKKNCVNTPLAFQLAPGLIRAYIRAYVWTDNNVTTFLA